MLIADKTKTKENITLDEMNNGDIDLALFFSYGNLNLKKKGKYYEGDLSNLNEYALKNITDYVFANNNTRGEVLKDCILDKKTTKIKIPSKYIDETTDNIPIQLEILSRLSPEEFSNLPVKVETSRYGKKVKNEKIEGSDTTTLISIAKYKELAGVSQDEIKVYVNDNSKLKYDDFAWDPTSGTIELNVNPILVRNVKVLIDKKTIVTNMLGILNVKAVKYGNMKVYAKLSEEPTIEAGTIKTINLSSSQFQYMNFQTDTAAKACSGISNDSTKWSKYMACKEGWKKAYGYSGSYTSSYVSAKNNDSSLSNTDPDQKGSFYSVAQNGTVYLDFLVKLTDRSIDGGALKFSTASNKLWISLACYHAGKGYGYDAVGGDEGYWPGKGDNGENRLQVKVLYTNDAKRYIVVGFKTSRVNSQNGFGIYKFSYDENESGKVRVHKKFENQDGSENTGSYTAAFGLYEDANCSEWSKLDEQYIDGQKVATFGELELDTYYVKETNIPLKWSPEVGTERQPTTCKAVTVTRDAPTVDIYYYNNPAKSCITIQKKSDVPGVPGVDATFEIYKGNDLVTTASTNSSNGYQITYGPFQDDSNDYYYYKELSSDPNYYNDHNSRYIATKYSSTGDSCVPPADKIISLTDVKKTYCTRLIKKDKTTSNVIRSMSSLCSEAERKGNVDSDYGTLSCQSLIDDKVISNKSTKFKVCSDANCNNVIADNLSTNELGIVPIRNLQASQDYYVKETQAPDGYTINPETLTISAATLYEQRNSYDRCTGLIDDDTYISPRYSYHIPNDNALVANENLNVYVYKKLGNQGNISDEDISSAIEKVQHKIERRSTSDSPDYDSNYYNYDYIDGNNIQINLIKKFYDMSDSSPVKQELKKAIDNIAMFDSSVGEYISMDNLDNYGTIIIIGKNIFIEHNDADLTRYGYNMNRLNSSAYDYGFNNNDDDSSYKKFFVNYLTAITSKKINDYSLESRFGFEVVPGIYSYEYHTISYYDMVKSITTNGVLSSRANLEFKADLITNVDKEWVTSGVDNLRNKETAVYTALYNAFELLKEEINNSGSGLDFDSSSKIEVHDLNETYNANGITIKNADLYPALIDTYYHKDTYRDFSTHRATVSELSEFPIIIIDDVIYSYDKELSGSKNLYKDYITFNSFEGEYDITGLTDFFYQKLREKATYNNNYLDNEFDNIEEQLAEYFAIRTPAGYLSLVNGTSNYYPQNKYDGSDQYGVLSVPFYNYKYKLNWYKETENGTMAAGAKFTVKKGSASIHHTGENNKISVTDDNGITKTCYMYSTNENDSTEFISDSNGEVCINGIEDGSYTITETKPADYHAFGDKDNISLNASENFYLKDQAKFINYETEFEFTKTVSSGDSDEWKNITLQQLKKIPFNITDSNGNVVSFIKKGDGSYDYSGNTIDPASGDTVTDLYLDDNRKFKVLHLPIGTYSVKEKKACCDSACPSCSGAEECTGFYYPNYTQESDYQFTITTCSNSRTTASSCLPATAATKSLINKPTQIEFTKKDLYEYADATTEVKFEDENERTAFDDMVFKLKNADGNYMSLVKVGNHGNCKTDDSYAEYRYVPTSMLGNMQATEELHTCGGHIHITHLCRGKKYTIEEYSVPENTVFTLPDEHIFKDYYIPYNEDGTACCDNPTNNPNTKVTIEDVPTRIALQKTNNRLSEDIKEGDSKKDSYNNEYVGKFKVYKCSKSVTSCTYDLSDKKAIKFLDLDTIENDQEDPGEKVYKYVFDQSVTGGYVQELKLNSNGKLILRYLPANYKYVVVEENAPAGYYNLNPSSNLLANLEVGVATNTTNKNYDFVNYPTILEFNKSDIYKYYKSSDLDKTNSSNKIFDSMTFKLHDYKGNVVSVQKVADGDYRYIQSDGNTSSNNVTELHTKDGKFVITNLHRKQTYYIEETKTDTLGNFILPNNINNTSLISSDAGSFRDNKHPVVKYEIPENISDETKKNSAPESLTRLINNLPTRVVFEKRDKSTNELIDDEKNIVLNEGKTDTNNDGINYGNIRTTFNVYYCEKTSENDTTPCEIDESRKVYFKQRQYVTDQNGVDITSDLSPANSNGNDNPEAPFMTYEYSKLNNSTGAVGDLITDRGLLVLSYLPSKYKYVLYEKTAPNGYYQPDSNDDNLKIQFRVEEGSLEDGKTYTALTSKNENTPTEIMFIKSDFYDYYNSDDIANLNEEVKLFDTARFVLRDADGNKLKLKKVKTTEEDGNIYRYLPVNDDNIEEKIYTYKGKLKITHLYRNSVYYIEEVGTTDPENFILPDYMEFENLPFDNKGHPVVKYVVPNTAPSDAITVTKEIENIPTRVRFEKRDSKYNYLILDETTTFRVYQCKKDTECHPTDENDENSTLIKFSDRHVLSGTDMYGDTHTDQEDPRDAEGLDGVEVYTYSKLNQGTVSDLHPYHGILVLRYLPAGYNYVLVETKAPKNFVLPKGRDAETSFSVVDNTVYVDANDVPNTPTSIIIKKYHENSDKLLAGAEFRVYRSQETCNFNQKPWAQTGLTPLKLKTIRDGVYEARPETDTETVKTCLDKEGSLCTDVSTNLSSSSEIFLTDDEYRDSYADFSNMVVKENIETDKKLTIHEGEALIQYLEYGHCYVIEETKAPTGYSLPKNKKDRYTMIQIDENEQYAHDTQVAFKNFPTPFTFFKYDEFNQPLDGAEFKLQKLNDNKIYEDIAVTLEEKEDKLFYKYEGIAKEDSNTVINTKEGQATVYYLPVGQYRIVETKAAPGKELTKNPNIATFFVDDSGNTFGNAIVVNKAETKRVIPKNSATAELIVNIQTGQVVIKYSVIIMTLISLIVGLILVKKKMD